MAVVSLDFKVFKALASGVRINILKSLKSRRYTQSELAELLNLKVPSVKEHLSALQTAELILKVDDGRKWKYYELTVKGKGVLEPEKTSIFLALGFFIISFASSLYFLIKKFLKTNFLGEVKSYSAIQMKQDYLADTASKSISNVNSSIINSQSNYLMYFFLILAFVSLALLIYFLVINKKKKALFYFKK